MHKSKKNRNLLEVFDEDGNLRTDEEAVEVWVKHFSKLLETHMDKDDNMPSQCSHRGVHSEYEDRL